MRIRATDLKAGQKIIGRFNVIDGNKIRNFLILNQIDVKKKKRSDIKLFLSIFCG